MLKKSSVEGSHRIEADRLTYLRNGHITLSQHSARIGNTDRVYVIVKAHIELLVHYMRNIVYVLGMYGR